MKLTLEFLDGTYNVHRLPVDADIDQHLWELPFMSVTRTPDEISIVCAEEVPLCSEQCSPGWRMFRVSGTLEHNLVGIIAKLSASLADAGVSVFTLATFDTDYILIPQSKMRYAVEALREAGHELIGLE